MSKQHVKFPKRTTMLNVAKKNRDENFPVYSVILNLASYNLIKYRTHFLIIFLC